MGVLGRAGDPHWGTGTPCFSLSSPLFCPSPPAGCLAEKWTGKKGDLASVGEKQSKKKSGKKKKKVRKDESEGAAALPVAGEALEESGVQEEAPLTHSPADEL